ncbi:MAG: FAD-dependent oxidoreductase [Ferrovibrio sp.]|nr:FAD-dependent oxidoreductase [Ferrovibrio sp.]
MRLDVAILGGGIAGLWLLARLRAQGYAAMLFEAEALGAGQTLASQGIIHGGLKYAIDLKLGQDADALADMPTRWRACLEGKGDVDLAGVQVNALHHLFWARRSIASRITGFFGSKLLRGRVDALPEADWPLALRDPAHVGAVYRLDEIVLDVPSLLAHFATRLTPWIKQCGEDFRIERMGDGIAALLLRDPMGEERRIEAGHYVFAAGAGNEQALAMLGQPAGRAQRRPLRMLLIEGVPSPLYAHCFDTSDKPRVTITTHRTAAGKLVWYVGGQIAEAGATQDDAALIDAAKREFTTLLPRLDLSTCRFAGWHVDRAEGATPDGRKPDAPVIQAYGNALLAWPTKLALAPGLADTLLPMLPPPAVGTIAADGWPAPPIATPIWERAAWR